MKISDLQRKLIGQALNDAIRDGAPEPDWTDSREIDRLVNAVVEVLKTETQS